MRGTIVLRDAQFERGPVNPLYRTLIEHIAVDYWFNIWGPTVTLAVSKIIILLVLTENNFLCIRIFAQSKLQRTIQFAR